MASRIIVNGRIWQSRDFKSQAGPPLIERGKELPIVSPQPQIIDVSQPYYDREDELHYRIVGRLSLEEGWLLDEQLMTRYSVMYAEILKLARSGLLDAAMEQGSPTKRFRIRDHEKIREQLIKWGRRDKRETNARYAAKKATRRR